VFTADLEGNLLVFHAHYNAVRMKEISHRRAFAKEFGIGSDLELQFRPAGISGHGFLQLHAGQRRHRAFLHHQL